MIAKGVAVIALAVDMAAVYAALAQSRREAARIRGELDRRPTA
ncbi:hypothetical protein [Micromonospora sp. WMMD736]